VDQEDEFAEQRVAFEEYKRMGKQGIDRNDHDGLAALAKYFNENRKEYDEFEMRVQAELLGIDPQFPLGDIRTLADKVHQKPKKGKDLFLSEEEPPQPHETREARLARERQMAELQESNEYVSENHHGS
jgi:hypothetical protein